MHRWLHIALLGAALSLVQTLDVLAQTGSRQTSRAPALIDLSLEALGQLEVVTASKTPESIWDTSAAVWVLTQEDIRRSGATSLPELIRLVPGVQVSRIDSSHWAVGVRGFADSFSKSLLVLIDGRSVYTPLFAGVYWGSHDVLVQDIDRIEVIRGPGGTIWGSNAVNGVINVITKPARDTRGLAASLGGGNVSRGIAELRYGGGRDGRVDYRLSAKAFRRAPQYHADKADWDEWGLGQVGFRSDWYHGNGGTFTLQGDVYRGSNGQRVSIGVLSPPSQQVNDDPLNISGGNLIALWSRPTGPRGRLEIQAYYDRTNIDAPHFAEVRDTFDVDFLHTIGLTDRHTLSWGAGARRSPGRFRQVIPTLDFTPRTQTASYLSAFVQDEIAIVRDRLVATVGTKIERNHYTGAETQPSVRVRWTPDARQTLWGAVSRAVRTPSRIEADISLTGFLLANPLAFSRVAGNPDIDAETLVGYEVGYRRLLASRFHLDIATFHNSYDRLMSNRLVTVPPPPYFVLEFPFANGVEGAANGGEFAIDWNAAPWWRVRSAYSRVSVNLRNKPGDIDVTAVNRYEGSAPSGQLHVQSSMNLPRGVQFDQTYRYAGALSTRGVGAYHTGDVRLAWRARPAFEVSIAGRDLFSPNHVEFPHSPGPNVGVRRSVFASVSWSVSPDVRP